MLDVLLDCFNEQLIAIAEYGLDLEKEYVEHTINAWIGVLEDKAGLEASHIASALNENIVPNCQSNAIHSILTNIIDDLH